MDYYQMYQDLVKGDHMFTFSGPVSFRDKNVLKEYIEKIVGAREIDDPVICCFFSNLIRALEDIYENCICIKSQEMHINEWYVSLSGKSGEFRLVTGINIFNNDLKLLKTEAELCVETAVNNLKEAYFEKIKNKEVGVKSPDGERFMRMMVNLQKLSVVSFHVLDENNALLITEFRISDK
jgi:hypothetical protein